MKNKSERSRKRVIKGRAKVADSDSGVLKRLLIFFLIMAIIAGGIFLFAWLRGETTPEEPTTTSKIVYYTCWAFALLLIYCVTNWVLKGKQK